MNPHGRPKGIIHTLKDRQNRFLETLSRGEILALADDEQRLNTEYKAFDAQVILGLAETLRKTPDDKLDPMRARENLYDRNLGKSTQQVEQAVTVKHEMDLDEYARQTAFLLEAARRRAIDATVTIEARAVEVETPQPVLINDDSGGDGA